MATNPREIDLKELSKKIRGARDAKAWTLEQLSHELWQSGLPTSHNKLWRLENKPPKRVDTELLHYLEKVLEVELIDSGDKKQVFIEDVIELVDLFVAAELGTVPNAPADSGLHEIHERLVALAAKD